MKNKDLIQMLLKYPEDMEITNEQNQNYVHIVNRKDNFITLSTKKPIGYCGKCGDYAYEEKKLDYKGVCPTCDENLYDFEIKTLN